MNSEPFSNALRPEAAEVIQIEETDAQLIERAKISHSESAWTIGECAAKWIQKYASGRSDADFGALIGMSQQDVNKRRRVWERFGESYALRRNLSWTHFREALPWPDADEILDVAGERQMSVAAMQAYQQEQHAETRPDASCETSAEIVATESIGHDEGEAGEALPEWATGEDEPSAPASMTDRPELERLRQINRKFATLLKTLLPAVREHFMEIHRLMYPKGAAERGGFPMQKVDEWTANLIGVVRSWRPNGPCSHCDLKGCKHCDYQGWLRRRQS